MIDCIVLDAHLSSSLALWIKKEFNIECYSLKFLGLREATDEIILKSVGVATQ